MPDSESATQNFKETTGFISVQKKKFHFVDLCNDIITVLEIIFCSFLPSFRWKGGGDPIKLINRKFLSGSG